MKIHYHEWILGFLMMLITCGAGFHSFFNPDTSVFLLAAIIGLAGQVLYLAFKFMPAKEMRLSNRQLIFSSGIAGVFYGLISITGIFVVKTMLRIMLGTET